MRCTLIALCVALLCAQSAHPQEVAPHHLRIPDEPPVRVEAIALPAVLGSAGGLVLGGLAGYELGIGGGDDPGLLGVVIFGVAGSALGTAAGIELGSQGRARFPVALGSSVAGIVIGLGVATAAASLFDPDDEAGFVVGYSVGQGAFASIMTSILADP